MFKCDNIHISLFENNFNVGLKKEKNWTYAFSIKQVKQDLSNFAGI